ncbi:MAG: hypothetical protein Tsb0034_28670 [Ekhidna sp.]
MRIGIPLFLVSSIVFGQQKLIDDRDGNEYQIVKLENIYWMKENLRYEAEGSLCFDNCSEIRFYDFNYLKGVCPKGWRLPIMHEWDSFAQSFSDSETARMMEGNKKLYRVDFLNQYNIFETNVLNIQPYGRVEGGTLGTGNFIDFWTVNLSTKDQRFHMHITPYSIVGHGHKHHLKASKPDEFRLFPIRCVCEAGKVEGK